MIHFIIVWYFWVKAHYGGPFLGTFTMTIIIYTSPNVVHLIWVSLLVFKGYNLDCHKTNIIEYYLKKIKIKWTMNIFIYAQYNKLGFFLIALKCNFKEEFDFFFKILLRLLVTFIWKWSFVKMSIAKMLSSRPLKNPIYDMKVIKLSKWFTNMVQIMWNRMKNGYYQFHKG
jgi:hypothetical protein